jgi:hypothetical protein
MPYISWSLKPPTQPAFSHAPPTRSLGVMTYVVLAERPGQRAGRLESRTIGTVDADTVETARLMATTLAGVGVDDSRIGWPSALARRRQRASPIAFGRSKIDNRSHDDDRALLHSLCHRAAAGGAACLGLVHLDSAALGQVTDGRLGHGDFRSYRGSRLALIYYGNRSRTIRVPSSVPSDIHNSRP